jgi:hypothetical protein
MPIIKPKALTVLYLFWKFQNVLGLSYIEDVKSLGLDTSDKRVGVVGFG